MKQLLFIVTGCLLLNYGLTQSTAGLTGKRDTSYTIYSAYQSTKKTHPDIRVASLQHLPGVKRQNGIIYSTTGGRDLSIDVFYPAVITGSPRTAVIILHGGGWRSGDRTLHHPLAERLAELGYVCFTPEYRLSTEVLYPLPVLDVIQSVKWVRKNKSAYNIDPDKIVVAGHSAGGQLAAFVGSAGSKLDFEDREHGTGYSKVNAVIDIDGILAFIHPESGEGDDSKRISAATNYFGYSKVENPELWKKGSALTYVGPHTPPTLFINSAVERMHAGRDDYIKLADQYNIYTEVKKFDAPHSFVLFEPWFTPVSNIIDSFLNRVFKNSREVLQETIFVAQDGTGHYKSIQEAFNAIPAHNMNPVRIFVRNGVYKEKLLLDSTKNNVTLIGEDKFRCVITFNDHSGKISPSGDTINTRTSWTFKIKADEFTAKSLTFQNDAGFSAGQAVAVESAGDKAFFENCRFLGNQDVLFTSNDNSRQYFKDCYIEGTTDFIFGSSTAWFERCHIHSKKNSHITAASTPMENKFGYIFNACILTGDTSLRNVSLGRPWRPYAHVIYMHCYIGPHIKAEGWSNWNNTEYYKTTRYAEYKNFGPSAIPLKRVNWVRQLNEEEANKITSQEVLKGWNPIQ